MKQTLVFCSVLLITASSTATAQQSSISGIVSIHNSEFDTGKRKYVTNAQVEDDFEKANSQVTDAQGIFKLIFVGVPEKTTVNLIVKKEGLEVVNIDALGAVTGQRDQVRLSMAAPNKIAEYRRQIYNIGKTEAEKNLTALLQKKGKAIVELQKDAKANVAKIQTLQTEYAALSEQNKKIEELAEELARKYAPINLDDASPLYQDAFRSFQKGELDQALKILQQANLAQQAEKILKERQGIATIRKEADQRDSIQQQRTADVIAALQFKADLHKNRYEFDSTVVCYEIMLELDANNTTTLSRYASFLTVQRQDQKAILIYEKVLHLIIMDDQKAITLNGLGFLYGKNNKMPEAERAFQESLKIRRQLAAHNPDAFLPKVAITLNNLGEHYRENNKMPEAERAYQESLQIRRQLAAKDPDAFLDDLARTLNNLGMFYRNNNKMPESEKAYQESLQISRQLAAHNPDTFLPYLATTLDNLGGYYRITNKMRQAEGAYQESLQIYRQLAAKNPDAFLPGLATILNNLGLFYNSNQKTLEAEQAYEEALQICRQLAAKNPDAFLPGMAVILDNLGGYYKITNKMPESEKAYQEALQICRQLAAKTPDAFLDDLARTLNNLGLFYSANQKMPEAGKAYQEALQIYRQLAAQNPDVFLPGLATFLGNLGGFYSDSQNTSQAEKAYEESLQISRQLAAKNPNAYLPSLANTLNSFGWFYYTLKKYNQASKHYSEAISIRERAILNGGEHFFQDWLLVLRNIDVLRDSTLANNDYVNTAKASRLIAESADQLKDLELGQGVRTDAINFYGSLSWDALFIKDFALVEKAALRCLELDREQEWMLTNLGHSYLLRGQYSQAQTTYEKLKGKKDDAGKAYKQVLLDDFAILKEAGITHPDMTKMKAWIEGW